MKILILNDGMNWIVDRIINRMIEGIAFDFTKSTYTAIKPNEFLSLSKKHDLVHYGNWDIERHLGVLNTILESTPFLLTIRSHRYPAYVKEIATKVTCIHVVNPQLLSDFPNATYIPDGIFECFHPKQPFTVGFAGLPDSYKGFNLISQACKELKVKFKPATGNIPPEKMADYYRSIDLYICASAAEGFSTPVMECMAMNIPVITTDVGLPSTLNVTKIERSVESIKTGILKFYTNKQVLPLFSWNNINPQFYDLYRKVIEKWHSAK